jgi:uncharacterized membrane protein
LEDRDLSKNRIKTVGPKSKSKTKEKSNQKKATSEGSTENDSKKLTAFQRWRIRARGILDERLKTESMGEIVLKFFIAPIICVIGALLLYLFLDYSTFTQLGSLMLAYFFPPLGKESIIPIGVGSGEITIPIINQHIVVQKINPILMASSITFVDIMTGLFLLWNYDFTKLIPYAGAWMDKLEKTGGKKFKENAWLEGLFFFGLVLFIMFPFQGSGGVGTTIVGRVLGMDKYKTLLAISIGSLIGCFLIAFLSELFLEFFRSNLLVGLIIAIIIIIIVVLYLIFKSKKNKEKKQ